MLPPKKTQIYYSFWPTGLLTWSSKQLQHGKFTVVKQEGPNRLKLEGSAASNPIAQCCFSLQWVLGHLIRRSPFPACHTCSWGLTCPRSGITFHFWLVGCLLIPWTSNNKQKLFKDLFHLNRLSSKIQVSNQLQLRKNWEMWMEWQRGLMHYIE